MTKPYYDKHLQHGKATKEAITSIPESATACSCGCSTFYGEIDAEGERHLDCANCGKPANPEAKGVVGSLLPLGGKPPHSEGALPASSIPVNSGAATEEEDNLMDYLEQPEGGRKMFLTELRAHVQKEVERAFLLRKKTSEKKDGVDTDE